MFHVYIGLACVVFKSAVPLMESALYFSCIYPMLLFMLTARPIEALPSAKGCLLFVGWAKKPLFKMT